MLYQARDGDFQPCIVLFDSWYASIENLKTLRKFGRHWLTQLKKTGRRNNKNMQIYEIEIPPEMF
jgi:putative transposase